MGARLNGIQEVPGSNPGGSTIFTPKSTIPSRFLGVAPISVENRQGRKIQRARRNNNPINSSPANGFS